MILTAIDEAQRSGARLATACDVVGISARTVERWRGTPDGVDQRRGPRMRAANGLSMAEERLLVDVMTCPRFRRLSPKQLVPALADEGLYLASESTCYRVQQRRGLRRQPRGTVRRAPTRARTVHTATGPNQVWSWDITWLPTTVRGRYLYLYLMMDVWSRRIVGWTVEEHESADLAAALFRRTCAMHQLDPHGLVLHSDNGSAMRGATMLATLQALGVVASFSRPHVSDDNPYSEALFRTLKHTPAYPSLPFADAAQATSWVARFVTWYNGEHRHSALRFVTPDERHFGREGDVLRQRRALYERARRANPERWSRGIRNWTPVGAVTLDPNPRAAPAAAAT